MYIPNLSVVCFFICLSYFIFYCALLLFCAQAWHGKTLSSRNDPIFFCSLHWRNLSLYNKITTTHFKQIRFWWKNVIKFRGKVYSNFCKFVQQLSFLSVCPASLKDKPWLMTWSIIVARISFETWARFCPLAAAAPPPRTRTPLPRAPLPWPLTLLPCLWPRWSMLANSNTEVASFVEGWGLIADWRVVQTSFTQVHWRFIIMQ